MDVIFQTYEQLSLFFADLIEAITGLPDDKTLLQYDQMGKASANINTDIAYVNVVNEPDERTIFKNRTKEFDSETNTYTIYQQASRTLNLHVVFYGPNCMELCTTFSESLYHESIKLKLRQNYLSIVPDSTNGPIFMPENRNGQWFKRCDFNIRLYNTVITTETVGIFSGTNINLEFDL